MKPTNRDGLRVSRKTFAERQTVAGVTKVYTYDAWAITGWLGGQRIRKQAPTQGEALTIKERLEVEAANKNGTVRTVLTRLTGSQVQTAEALFELTPDPLAAVQWYIANYRPPVVSVALDEARDAFLADRTPHVSKCVLRDYKRTLGEFVAMFGMTNPSAGAASATQRTVHTFKTDDIEAFLKTHARGPKNFNNLRASLNAFFNYCLSPARKWATENPVEPIAKFKIARGIPAILTPEKAAELMALVETFQGGPRSKLPPGCLAPYFALCLFGGIRPSLPHGEVHKLGLHPNVSALVDRVAGIVRIPPEVSKVGELRFVKIRPNLAAWLSRFPPEKYPIIPKNAQALVTEVRKKFELGDDVLRHSFISAHVAAFKSIGEAAIEAGNSEAMIRKHYLHAMTDAAAAAFWKIVPTAATV